MSIFWSDLIPNLKESALAEDPESYRELQEFISTLKIQPKVSDIVGTPVNTCFHFQENEAGISSCGVSFGEKCCSLTFQIANGAEQLRAGFGYFEFSTLQLTDVRPHQVAASARWLSPTVLEIESLICDGIYRDIWTIDFSDKEEPLKNQGLCGCFRPLKPRFLLSR